MSESNTTSGVVLGASTTAAGVASLPFTGSNETISVLAVVAIALGIVIVLSQLALRAYKITNR